jgi:hypothetical protein
MALVVIFGLGMAAAVPFLLGMLWLAARFGDMLPDDPAELAVAYARGSVPHAAPPADPITVAVPSAAPRHPGAASSGPLRLPHPRAA